MLKAEHTAHTALIQVYTRCTILGFLPNTRVLINMRIYKEQVGAS